MPHQCALSGINVTDHHQIDQLFATGRPLAYPKQNRTLHGTNSKTAWEEKKRSNLFLPIEELGLGEEAPVSREAVVDLAVHLGTLLSSFGGSNPTIFPELLVPGETNWERGAYLTFDWQCYYRRGVVISAAFSLGDWQRFVRRQRLDFAVRSNHRLAATVSKQFFLQQSPYHRTYSLPSSTDVGFLELLKKIGG